jgi:hypothetical protein
MKVRRIANVSCLLLSLTVFYVSPARPAQSAQSGDQQSLAAIRAACAEDAKQLCAGVQPGGGRIVACLREHKDSLSDGCRKATGLAANPSSSSAAPSAPSTSPTSESQPAGAATTPAAKPAPAPGTGTKAPAQIWHAGWLRSLCSPGTKKSASSTLPTFEDAGTFRSCTSQIGCRDSL